MATLMLLSGWLVMFQLKTRPLFSKWPTSFVLSVSIVISVPLIQVGMMGCPEKGSASFLISVCHISPSLLLSMEPFSVPIEIEFVSTSNFWQSENIFRFPKLLKSFNGIKCRQWECLSTCWSIS